MDSAFFKIIERFAQEVEMEELFAQSFEFLIGAVLILAVLSCFFGFKLFRIFSAVMAFLLTAIGICQMLKPIAHMGVVVTTFAIIGIIAAFIVHQWYKVSVFIVSALIGYSIAAMFISSLWVCIGAGIVLGTISIPFSAMLVILCTSIWGGITLGLEGARYIELQTSILKILLIGGLVAAGLIIQYRMNKNEDLFKHTRKRKEKETELRLKMGRRSVRQNAKRRNKPLDGRRSKYTETSNLNF